jgi:hypothetical protein
MVITKEILGLCGVPDDLYRKLENLCESDSEVVAA